MSFVFYKRVCLECTALEIQNLISECWLAARARLKGKYKSSGNACFIITIVWTPAACRRLGDALLDTYDVI